MAPPDRRRRPLRRLGGLLIALGGILLGARTLRARPARPKAVPRAEPQDPVQTDRDTSGYEVRDARAGVVGLVMLAGVLVIAGSVAGLFVMIGRFRVQDALGPSLTAQQRAVIAPPGPVLQDHPLVDIAALRKREEALLTSYGWADTAHARARIPIDRAIALVIGRSLDPAPQGAPGPKP